MWNTLIKIGIGYQEHIKLWYIQKHSSDISVFFLLKLSYLITAHH